MNTKSNPSLLQSANVTDDLRPQLTAGGRTYLSTGCGSWDREKDITTSHSLQRVAVLRSIADRPKHPIDCSAGGKRGGMRLTPSILTSQCSCWTDLQLPVEEQKTQTQ